MSDLYDEEVGLSLSQRLHGHGIAQDFAARMLVKYARGAVKHGGDLLNKTALELVDEAIDEAIDQAVYLMTLRDKLL